LKTVSTLRLFQAGVVAACLQCLVILLLTPIVITFAQSGLDEPASHVAPTSLNVTSLLQMTYLLIALGLAFTNNRFVDSTAAYIRVASRQMHPLEPNLAASTLLICLWFTAVGLAALTLGPPPSFLTELRWHFGPFEAAPIIWSSMTSVGVAAFGANALATEQGQN
jgi:hypothetical protein